MPQAIREFGRLDDAALRREVLQGAQPAVLRGVVEDWPAVREGRRSASALVAYLMRFDNGSEVDALMTRPEEEGRIFYTDDLAGFNFLHNRLPLARLIEQVLRYAAFPNPPAVAAQSALLRDCLPGFAEDNPLPLLGPDVLPRLWLGNSITTPAHFDEARNIACVVAGRRRFTLFPPEQVGNLYVGPLDHTPTATPISLVSMRQPDFSRHPRYREALEAAQVAELGPGDALFIPTLWWHQVESLAPFNLLVNYWWSGSIAAGREADSGLDAMLHAMLVLRDADPALRAAWRALFDHYVFDPTRDAAAHLPVDRRGVLGPIGPEMAERLRGRLAARLRR
ncbi:MAG: cupin-like domain-containing protein [Pseudomonadota bacterium]|nr:cupin-like domain-containing protein [Pseudomonadota bacterium]